MCAAEHKIYFVLWFLSQTSLEWPAKEGESPVGKKKLPL